MKENMTAGANEILAVKIPRAHWNDSRVKEIVEQYEKSRKKRFWIFFFLQVVGYPIRGYMSLTMLWFWIYLFGLIYVYTMGLNHSSNQLKALKKSEGWGGKVDAVVRIDTEVSRKKNTFLVKWQYFLIPLGLMIPTVFYVGPESLWTELGASAFVMGTTYLCGVFFYIMYRRLPTKVYSEDTEINLAANRVCHHEWSKIGLLFSWSAIVYIPVLFAPTNELYYTNEIHLTMQMSLLLLVTLLVPVFIVVIFVRTNKKIKEEQEKILNPIEDSLEVDDDEYWNMFMYSNPHDKRLWVPRKVGVGFTINMGHTAGKVVMAGIAVMTIATIIWSTVIMIAVDFYVPTMRVEVGVSSDGNINDKIVIAGIDDTLHIDIEDVSSVQMITELPSTYRINGSSTERVKAGEFRVSGYGMATLEIMVEVPIYIQLELEDETYIFFNGQTEEITEEYYQEIKSLL